LHLTVFCSIKTSAEFGIRDTEKEDFRAMAFTALGDVRASAAESIEKIDM